MKEDIPDKKTKKEIARIGKILRAVHPKRSKMIVTRASEPIGIKCDDGGTIIEFAQAKDSDTKPQYWYKTHADKVIHCSQEKIHSLWQEYVQNKTGSSCRKDTEDYVVFAFHQYNIGGAKLLFGAVGAWGEDLKENVKGLIQYSEMNHGKKHRLIIKGADNLTELINELDVVEIEIDKSIPKGIFYIEQL